ncbi:MAG: glycoside hydrolase family 3 C-terminal domain-containing protein [Oscillospiraceae bacterium]|nr:glycoside hydrolase family 3 C-terminal domain-containing protein [Oscillospiraceae bacterium]
MTKAMEILNGLTLEEKASLTSGKDCWRTVDIEGKLASIMMSDGPHGLRKEENGSTVPATCFPSSATIANSWDEDLIYRIGEALGEECLANDVQVILGPGVNIKRSPLCGRNFEYFSEDPLLATRMASSHIRGVQSKGVGACIKHFAANNQETDRFSVNAVIDERTLREIYLSSFEEAVKVAKPWMIMSAYNKLNGDYCSENKYLLTDILRDEWGYEGVVVSDWGAANEPVDGVKAGLDIRMPGPVPSANNAIVEAVKSGELSMEELDKNVLRIIEIVEKGIASKIADYKADMSAHNELAMKAAEESAVLLKNNKSVLPLAKTDKIALIGAFAEEIRYQGGGSSCVNATEISDLLKAFDDKNIDYTYAKGFRTEDDSINDDLTAEALAVADKADKIVMCIGLPFRMESEGFDRWTMSLPSNQIELFNKLSALKKPIVIVLFQGSPVEMEWSKNADSILAMYTGGQAVAKACVNLLFGDANPSGKLSETWALKLENNPTALSFPEKGTATYSEGVYVGYRYYDKKKLNVMYPFGYGLSYTTFEYSDLKLSAIDISESDTLEVSFEVKNTGSVAGKEVCELYVEPTYPSVSRPVKELKGFKKIYLEPGEEKTVTITLNKRSFAYYDVESHDWQVDTTVYNILVGSSSRNLPLTASVKVNSSRTSKTFFTTDSRVYELNANPIAKEALSKLLTEDLKLDITALSIDLPLSKLVGFSGGILSVDMLDRFVASLNEKIK